MSKMHRFIVKVTELKNMHEIILQNKKTSGRNQTTWENENFDTHNSGRVFRNASY